MSDIPVSTIRALLNDDDPTVRASAMERFSADDRASVATAISAARRRAERDAAESERLQAMGTAEERLHAAGIMHVACVDEVGRGALAGPVTAAAVILPRGAVIKGLRDSKQLSADARSRIVPTITAVSIAWAVAHVDATEIDRVGIARATLMAMEEALAGLTVTPDHVLVDGLDVPLTHDHTAVVRGDSLIRGIAAASVLAKVARDALMGTLAEEFPHYDLAANKGYGSAPHLEALRDHGPSQCHRRSFSPCSQPPLF